MALEAFLLSLTLSEAWNLIATQNELAIQGGIFLLVLTIITAIASTFIWFPSLNKLFK
ncbi:hypothetical protein [Scytonema millei]|uniref:hypothetical protein n=1 Tax=Scytonema millei TaxID=1245922 RepID=UPI002572282A|nr:hypothetical protein [Scytonema millei]